MLIALNFTLNLQFTPDDLPGMVAACLEVIRPILKQACYDDVYFELVNDLAFSLLEMVYSNH